MEKAYRLGTVEEELFMMDFDYLPCDIAEVETSDGSQILIISGWWVHVPELGANIHQGAVCKTGKEMETLPEMYVNIIRTHTEPLWFYYEEADIITILFHWLEGQYSEQTLAGMPCYIRGKDLKIGKEGLP